VPGAEAAVIAAGFKGWRLAAGLVVTLLTPPEELPYSAENGPRRTSSVSMLNINI
jgi:hypothetical protein